MRFEGHTLGCKLFLVAGTNADNDCHVGSLHPLSDFEFVLVCLAVLIHCHQLVVDFRDFLLPLCLDEVIHSHGSKAVNAYNHSLAEITTVDNVVDNIVGNFVKASRTAEYFKFLGILLFKTRSFII